MVIHFVDYSDHHFATRYGDATMVLYKQISAPATDGADVDISTNSDLVRKCFTPFW
jgi:hypothetical protein